MRVANVQAQSRALIAGCSFLGVGLMLTSRFSPTVDFVFLHLQRSFPTDFTRHKHPVAKQFSLREGMNPYTERTWGFSNIRPRTRADNPIPSPSGVATIPNNGSGNIET